MNVFNTNVEAISAVIVVCLEVMIPITAMAISKLTPVAFLGTLSMYKDARKIPNEDQNRPNIVMN